MHNAQFQMKRFELQCRCCGASFVGGHHLARYCTATCKARAYQRRRRGAPEADSSPVVLQPTIIDDHDDLMPASWALPNPPAGTDQRYWQGTAIQRRQADGFVNATAMAKANGKHLPHYMANERTGEYLEALAGSVGIPTDRLTVTTMTGPNDLRGTWVHPRLAIDLARWISPAFAVWMDGWFLESISKPQQPPLQQGIHIVAGTKRDAQLIWASTLRKELLASLQLLDQDLYGTTATLPAPVQLHVTS